MNKRIIFIFALVMAMVLAVGAVSADENVTDAPSGNGTPDGQVIDEVTPEVVKENSSISANKTSGYASFSTKVTVGLKANNTPLASKPINITINKVTYKRTTDSKGLASVNVKLNAGTYDVKVVYGGDDNTTASTKTAKLIISNPKKTTIKVADKDINYRQGSKAVFIVRLLDENSKAVKNQVVSFTVHGKTYTAKTNSKGYAQIHIGLKKGTYTVKFSFSKKAPYLSSSGSYKIKVKAPLGKGNGYWVWGSHMKSLSLKSLSSKGTKQIFLHVQAIKIYGKSSVQSWIAKAHKYKMKVHLWMQVFYSGGKWVRPVNKDGSYNYKYMNSKISEAKSYAKIKGVDGIHFDYVRFGGTAHLYKNSASAVSYFVKKSTVAVHKIKPNLIVSVAIMPEPSSMKYYYGQDIPTISKYVDVLLPMVYKGNYGKNTAWIKSVTKTFVSQSKGAQVWTGLQAYKSDSNVKKLSSSELLKDARAAKSGGAKGVILFRYGVSTLLNFKKV